MRRLFIYQCIIYIEWGLVNTGANGDMVTIVTLYLVEVYHILSLAILKEWSILSVLQDYLGTG